jgi:2-C-methyl-D-erythritol 4-phosphate cytidylyltransferase
LRRSPSRRRPRPTGRRPDRLTIAALVVGAGRGVRLGAGRPKALVRLSGLTLLERSVAALARHPRVSLVVAVVPDPDRARALLGARTPRVLCVRGGAERQDSVRRGLEAVGEAGYVLVHDAARPLVPRGVIDRVIRAMTRHGAAVPALRPPDTVKRVAADGRIAATLPRESLRLAQTPQGFRTDLLRAAHRRARRRRGPCTDDAGLLERSGTRVVVVEGSWRNLKITTPEDLRLAEAILAAGGREEDGG